MLHHPSLSVDETAVFLQNKIYLPVGRQHTAPPESHLSQQKP